MPRTRTYLAGQQSSCLALLRAALAGSGCPPPTIAEKISISALGTAAPTLLIMDIDDLAADPIETLRMTRFVLPDCIIAIYTRKLWEAWALACHLAGANCMLSKSATAAHLTEGLNEALTFGCYTDPGFDNAPRHTERPAS